MKGFVNFADRMLAKKGALRAAVCASGIRVGQFCSGHDVQPANWGRVDCQTVARKQNVRGSLGVFLPPRLTRRGIFVKMMFLGRLAIGLQKSK